MSQCDAAILFPGLNTNLVNHSVDHLTQKIAHAMDVNAKTPGAKFLVKQGKDEDYAEKLNTRVLSIVRSEGGTEIPVLDIYEMAYAESLTSSLQHEIVLKKILRLGILLISNLPRLVTSLGRSSKTSKQKLQMVIATLILVVLLLYTALLVATAVHTVGQTPALMKSVAVSGTQTESQPPQANGPPRVPQKPKDAAASAQAPRLTIFQALIVILSALGLLTAKDYKENLEEAGNLYTAVVNYINLSERKGRLIGQVSTLLEHIAEKPAPYRRIHFLSYSFGAIVALDALFQHGQASERYRLVSTLVTIGCPFDFIRMYWPEYFNGRRALSPAHPQWLNVYNPIDMLGSNFRNDQEDKEANQGIRLAPDDMAAVVPENLVYTHGIALRDLSMIDLLYLTGFRAHASYWEGEEGPDTSCFETIIRKMYENDPVLD